MSIEVRVPTLGESVSEATIATWFKQPGDAVAADEMLCELETDKVTVEVPAPASGVLAEIVAAEGETVGVNALLAMIAEEGHAGPETPEPRKGADKQGSTEKAAEGGAGATQAGKSVTVKVPALGESVAEATVASWFKKVGETVAQDEMLCELETDKVSVEVPAPAAGVLSEILAEAGATVAAGGDLAVIGAAVAAKPGAKEDTAKS
jgi:2-oxoglutarate dehydrogenase E2 component (dihydrolipoamide succinyltransferase)